MLFYELYKSLCPQAVPIYTKITPKAKNKSLQFLATLSLNLGCGGKTRTYDLRVMSPTSCQLLHPAIFNFNYCISILFFCIFVNTFIKICIYFIHFMPLFKKYSSFFKLRMLVWNSRPASTLS